MTEPSIARELPYRETLKFLDRVLGAGQGTLLDVGCGGGAIAARLLARGFRVTAIDASANAVAIARGNGVDAIESDFLDFEATPFDVVLFSISLHHIHPLSGAFDRLLRLLKPGGLFIAEEFALDRVSAPTARWYYDCQSLLEAAGLFPFEAIKHPKVDDPLERWRADHNHQPPLHGGQALFNEAKRRFRELRTEEGPYLYRYLCQHLVPGPIGLRVGERLFQLETRAIQQGSLDAVGLRLWAARSE